MKEIRIIRAGKVHPLQVASIYEVLGRARDLDLAPDTLVFYQPKSPIVCFGYHQDPFLEVRISSCENEDIPFTRRITGGGAVYLDPGQLCFSIIIKDPGIKALPDIYARYLDGAIKGLKNLGIDASLRGKNDIEVNGRKIAGCSATFIGKTLVMANTLLHTFDSERAAAFLAIPQEKFRDKDTSTLEKRITTIATTLRRDITIEDVETALITGYADSLEPGTKLKPGELTPYEINALQKSVEAYKKDNWICQRTLRGSMVKGLKSAAHKSPGGLIHVSVSLIGKTIQATYLSGDFSVEPRHSLNGLEAALKGMPAKKGAILEKIEAYFKQHDVKIPHVSPEELAYAIMKATTSPEIITQIPDR